MGTSAGPATRGGLFVGLVAQVAAGLVAEGQVVQGNEDRELVRSAAFDRHLPGVRLTGLAAGFHAIAPLPAGVDETAVIAAARDRRVRLYGLTGYRGRPDPAAPPALVMGFGNVGERAIDPAIAAVADLLR